MYKQNYLKLAMSMDLEWLKQAAQSPSPYMTPMHVKLLKIAIRKKGKSA